MSGSINDRPFPDAVTTCPHNVIRIKRGNHAPTLYVCGSCASLFTVHEHREPEPGPREPMFDRRPPWGFRDRQA